VAGISELPHDQGVERALEGGRDLVRHHHAAPRDAVDDCVPVPELGQLGREQAAGLTAVGEAG
jgi:hypothetical protein